MRSNYKKLGPYIRQVDIRNKEGKEDNLLGVSTQKVFIESIANTVGTDFTKYKKVKRNQFTYVPDTSRRGDKIGLAMLEHLDEGLVSQVYTVFEIIDHNELDPEYLMMWFRRPEFDRYARYKSHGSVREIFGWDEMCDVELPIPSIEKQREIVREYNTIVNRIQLNEQMNQKLEETAQAIYKHWFVDFEFPISAEYAASIGKPELEGKPYKSSGGEMALCEELNQEIPAIFSIVDFGAIINVTSGKSPKLRSAEQSKDTPFPIFGAGGIMGFTSKSLFHEKILSIGRVGTHGIVQAIDYPCWPSDNTLIITSQFYEFSRMILLHINYDEMNRGGVQGLITQTDIKALRIIKPKEPVLLQFENAVEKILNYQRSKLKENEQILCLKNLLLSRLALLKNIDRLAA